MATIRVGLDAHMVGSRETGNETYVLGLVDGFAGVTDVELFVYHVGANAELGTHAGVNRRLWRPGAYTRLTFDLPLRTLTDRLDVVHTSYTAPLWSGCPVVLSVHDISYASHPEWFSARDLRVLTKWVPWSIKRAARVITISDQCRREIIETYSVPESKVVRVYIAAGPAARVMRPDAARAEVGRLGVDLSHPYILAVGNLQPRKNLVRLIEAFHVLIAGGLDANLVLVGPEHYRSDLVTSAASDLGRRVIFTGYVSNVQLAALYESARVFVFPSLYEGFGIPALEAMAHGTPVACANAGALPEVCGDAAMYFDPLDTTAIAATVRRVFDDDALRSRLASAGRIRQAQFSWERAARETLSVYREVVDRPGIGHTSR
jgi:glycosyltransferase involved in cell wall biosynthesis